MTDSEIRPLVDEVEVLDGTWAPIPGYFAEASHRGYARSVDRVLGNGRRVKGRLLATRVSNRGYVLIDVYDHDGVRQTRTLHTMVLEAHAGPCPDGMESLHENDNPLDNRYPENLRWGTPAENAADQARNAAKAATRETVAAFDRASLANVTQRRPSRIVTRLRALFRRGGDNA
jgi:hypothetical protein